MICSNGIFKVGSSDVDKVYKGNNLIWQKPINPLPIEPLASNGVLKITTANTLGFPSLYYPKMYWSSPFKPYFSGITKDYILLYSTDHAKGASTQIPINGAIGWGECDSPDLTGYVDKGVIISGYQSETPSLLINTNDPNGHHVWMFYHTDATAPNSAGKQQTRLLTTSGGVNLHDSIYTNRGTILGITINETIYSEFHSGYADAYVEDNGNITVIHITKGWTPYYLAKSSCAGNNYTFNRQIESIDITSFMPQDRIVHHSPSLFFKRNDIQYMVARNTSIVLANVLTDNFISIFNCDGNYQPISLFRNISTIDSGSNTGNAGYFIDEINDPDTLHIYYIKNKTQMFHSTWDLRNLD